MDFTDSALKHGIQPEAAEHAAVDCLHLSVLREEPRKELRIGLDPDGNPLEVILIDDPERPWDKVIIHAMPLRKSYYPLCRFASPTTRCCPVTADQGDDDDYPPHFSP